MDEAAESSNLQEQIHRQVCSIDGNVGIFAYRLKGGTFFSYRGREPVCLLSTYKIPIAIQCLRQVEQGLVGLDQKIEITPEDVVESSSILDDRHFSYPGVTLSVKNCLRLMLEYSDNTASDLILRLSGGPIAVQNFLDASEYSEISVNSSTGDLFKLQKQNPRAFPSILKGRNGGTPEGMVRLLTGVIERRILGESAATFLLECMQRCKTGAARIRALLPPEISVADKTGSMTGFVNDIGIIDLPADLGKIIISIFVSETSASIQKSESVIANVAKLLYEYAIADLRKKVVIKWNYSLLRAGN